MYQAVLFDLDGTLLNTLDDLTDAVNYVLAAQGWPLRTTEEIRCFVGNGIRKLIERAVPDEITEQELGFVFEEFKAYYSSHCSVKTVPYPGIPEVLTAFRNVGVALGVVSNKNEEAVETLVSKFFPGIFSSVVGQSLERAPKPAPDMLLYGVKQLGYLVESCLYVGDSEVDIITADRAGMDCASVAWGFRDKEQLCFLSPKYLFEKPGEMQLLLKK